MPFFYTPAPPVEEEPEPDEPLDEPSADEMDFISDNPDIADSDIDNLIAEIISKDVDNLNNDFSTFDNFDDNDNL